MRVGGFMGRRKAGLQKLFKWRKKSYGIVGSDRLFFVF